MHFSTCYLNGLRPTTSGHVTTLNELNEAELWTRWMLPDWPAEQISPQAVRLNQLWRQATGRRDPLPESKAVVTELFRRGYRLGLVSNTTSSTEVPQLLQSLEISGLFETVILSCCVRQAQRRPGDPAGGRPAHGRQTGTLRLHRRPPRPGCGWLPGRLALPR